VRTGVDAWEPPPYRFDKWRNNDLNRPDLQGFQMRDLMAVVKAMADETRMRIVMVLGGHELCVCQIVELLELAPSTVSKHMSILKQARLVQSRKEGRWMHYRLARKDAPTEVSGALAWVSNSLAGDSQVEQDGKRLQEILTIDREALCSQQNKSLSGNPAPSMGPPARDDVLG
jgi:ArsR family transcriptional regulator